jgi:hypothetical protein
MGVVSASYFLWSLSPELTKLSFAVVPVFGVAAIGYGEYRKKLAQSLLTRLARENQVRIMEEACGIALSVIVLF